TPQVKAPCEPPPCKARSMQGRPEGERLRSSGEPLMAFTAFLIRAEPLASRARALGEPGAPGASGGVLPRREGGLAAGMAPVYLILLQRSKFTPTEGVPPSEGIKKTAHILYKDPVFAIMAPIHHLPRLEPHHGDPCMEALA